MESLAYLYTMSNAQNTATMNDETTINYYKKIEDACKSFGYTSFNDQMDVINLMRKKDTTAFRIADEMITVSRDYNNYPGANNYKVEITY